MENRRILIDTSIVIEYLRSYEREHSTFVKLFKDNDLNKRFFCKKVVEYYF